MHAVQFTAAGRFGRISCVEGKISRAIACMSLGKCVVSEQNAAKRAGTPLALWLGDLRSRSSRLPQE